MPFQYNGTQAKKLCYNGTPVKKAYYNNTVFFESANFSVGSLTLDAAAGLITISDLPFTPAGVMAVSICENFQYATTANIYDVSGSSVRVATSNYSQWAKDVEIIYVVWASGAGTDGYQVVFPAQRAITVLNLGFTPKGVFAFSSGTFSQGATYIRAMQHDTESAIEHKLYTASSQTALSDGELAVSSGSATFGVSQSGASDGWNNLVYYFIW